MLVKLHGVYCHGRLSVDLCKFSESLRLIDVNWHRDSVERRLRVTHVIIVEYDAIRFGGYLFPQHPNKGLGFEFALLSRRAMAEALHNSPPRNDLVWGNYSLCKKICKSKIKSLIKLKSELEEKSQMLNHCLIS